MEQSAIDRYKHSLGKYVPAAAVDPLFDFMDKHKVHLHVTRERHSKLGDYRWPQPPRHYYHEISVNGNLNPYFFLWVLLHEMAHLNNYQRYGTNVQPHGHEWQEEYRRLLMGYLGCFPEDVAGLLRQYCSRIPLNHAVERRIELLLPHYDEGYEVGERLLLDNLMPGTRFRIKAKPQRVFEAVEKRRTRWICSDVATGQQFLVYGAAEVEVCGED